MNINFIYPQPPGERFAEEPNYFVVDCEERHRFCLETKSWWESDIIGYLDKHAPSKVVSVQQVVGPRFLPCAVCEALLPDPYARTCADVAKEWAQRDWKPCR